MGSSEIITKIAISTGIPKDSCKRVLDALIDEVTNSLCNGEDVKLRGFVNFELSKRSERTIKDLNTGEYVKYPEMITVNCRASKLIKDALNE